jgi:hypothetical protein
LEKETATYVFPIMEDTDEILASSIETVLKDPVISRRGEFYFEELEGRDLVLVPYFGLEHKGRTLAKNLRGKGCGISIAEDTNEIQDI